MKKDILFIMNNLNVGGAEKALVSLLRSMDYSKYNVDLFLIKKEGAFLNQVPIEVHMLPQSKYFTYFDMSIFKAITENLKAGRFMLILYRILAGFVFKTEQNPAIREQKVWKYIKKVMLPLEKEYDVAIGYLEKTPNYFCVDKVNALKKIGFIHTDYTQLKMDAKIDLPYFNKLDHILTVSKTTKDTLEKVFPSIKNKFDVMQNIVSKETIIHLASKKIDFKKKGISIVSLGRLSAVKGYDFAINACKILIDKGVDVYWYILGEGEERALLEKLIKANDLGNRFILLGAKENPYPYLKKADIFVHTAKYEGFGIVVAEAKILNKPMVITKFNTAHLHIKHNYNGLLADLDPKSIAENIEKLYRDKNLMEKFSRNLSPEDSDSEKEINNFYKIIEN